MIYVDKENIKPQIHKLRNLNYCYSANYIMTKQGF
jgi:hypothetical protein